MKVRSRILSIALALFAVLPVSAPADPRQGAPSSPVGPSLPNLAGLDLVDSFTQPREGLTNLRTLCDMRTDSVEAAKTAIGRAIAASNETINPMDATRANNAMGLVYLFTGDMDGAIRYFEEGYRIASTHMESNPQLREVAFLTMASIGVAHLRRGEVENCARNHNAEMCIFPLSDAARHTEPTGSSRAIEYFERCLSIDPSNLEIRWLLNIAYQTLGKYPDKVPKAYLIPPAAFASKEDIGKFVDVAPQLGLDTVGNAGGAIVDDFDNDGFLDIVQTGVDMCEAMHMWRNNGDGTFSDVSARSGLAELLGGINCIQTDYNNDGWLDILVLRGGWEFPMRNSLLRNNRDGTFADVTAEAGLMDPYQRTHSAAWADYDGDGWLDVFVGHELTPSQLFRNKGDGTFEDVSARAGVNKTAFTKGDVWGDYDDDGRPDLYVSNFNGDNFLYRNNGDGTFTDVATQLGVEKPKSSFPCWFWDYDNDGRLDIWVGSYTSAGGQWVLPYLGLPPQLETMKLYRNTGKGAFAAFADVTKEVGLDWAVAPMGVNFGDLDNDGYLDFYLGTGNPSYSALMPNLMFRNHDGKYFVDVTTSTGTGQLQKGHGIGFADVDNDGDEDVYSNVGGAIPGDKFNKALFQNPGHGNNWIAIKLVGVKANRVAIGAKIKLTLSGPAGANPIRYREVTSGGSFGSSSLMQHIGIGKATKIASIEIVWPGSGTRQVFQNVAANQFVEIKESDKTFTQRKIAKVTLKTNRAPAHHHVHAN
jgi:hypothetical protein